MLPDMLPRQLEQTYFEMPVVIINPNLLDGLIDRGCDLPR